MKRGRLVWVTDPHLNFVDEPTFDAFCEAVATAQPTGVLLGGDVAEAPDVVEWLHRLAARWATPIYFVLGNHDYYRGSVADVRARVRALQDPRLTWLSESEPLFLTPTCALVGHDGWGDARLGDYESSPVFLNDFLLIEELAGLSRPDLRQRLHALGDEAARHLDGVLTRALSGLPDGGRAVVLTHVPPFVEAAWHEGRFSDDAWAPFFTCKAVGDVVLKAADAFPRHGITVLCGHTHGEGEQRGLRPNLEVYTGGATYGHPAVARVLDI